MKQLLAILLGFCCVSAYAQLSEPKYLPNDPSLPDWVKLMYAEKPNLHAAEDAYAAYYRTHEFVPTIYTAQFRRWAYAMRQHLDENGYYVAPSTNYTPSQAKGGPAAIWSFAGPDVHLNAKYDAAANQRESTEQANTYTIDRSLTNPNVLFCGTESGGVYKTTNQGANWVMVSRDLPVTAVESIRIHPADENTVIFQAAGKLWKTTDGGSTWNVIYQAANLSADDILFHPTQPNIIFVASNLGLLRSDDDGTTWTTIIPSQCRTVQFRPGTPNVVYTMAYNATTNVTDFMKSTDTGLTFTPKPTGWFQVPAANAGQIESYGGKLAVTAANPDRIYALVVGQNTAASTLILNGFIGVYRSDDAGETWTLPRGSVGAPYDATTNPNLMNFNGDDGDYNQIYYNTSLIASQLDADKIMVGGLSLWKSEDAAGTFTAAGGYAASGGVGEGLHVDFQELDIYQTSPTTEEVWIASDGGVNYSTDFISTNVTKTRGIYAGAFWGFDQGWNEDVMVGGRYHNGDAGYYEGYNAGEFLALGGGEQPTGYVNYGANEGRTTHFSDIGGRILPETSNGVVEGFGSGAEPNESYWNCNSSRTAFDWEYWNTAFMGKDNTLWKSTDGGSSFSTLYTFGTTTTNTVLWFEQNYTNGNVLYVQQVVGSVSKIWKTTDGGQNWTQLTLPQNKRDLYFSLGTNPDEIYIAYSYGTSGNNVYKSTNGGSSWTNLTTTLINGKEVRSIAAQYGTDGGVYVAMQHGGVYYRNNSMSDWQPYLTNLPAYVEPLRLVPLYKDNKIRLATWNMSIWEADLYENSNLIVNFSTEKARIFCAGEEVRFAPHCVASDNATYEWTFNGGVPATSTDKYPVVTFANIGSYDVTLRVTDNGNTASVTKTNFVYAQSFVGNAIPEDFESGGFQPEWRNSGWQVTNTASAHGTGTYSAIFDNYNQDTNGRVDELVLPNQILPIYPAISFSYAYAIWSGAYPDSLAVAISTDCGLTKTRLWVKSQNDLATGPVTQNNIFVPTATQWRDTVLTLFPYEGQDVTIYFQNIGHYGQAIYLDNINISTPVTTSQPIVPNTLNIYPNPTDGEFTVAFKTDVKDTYTLRVSSALGQVLAQKEFPNFSGELQEMIDLEDYPEGAYFVTLSNQKGMSFGRFVMKD